MITSLTQNYFELFALPVAYAIDQNTLRERYRELQKSVHPDRYAGSTEQSRRLAAQLAAQVNQAFQTLKDPILRGFYLLSLHGVVAEGENQTINDTEFLIKQMAYRERLEACAGHPATGSLLTALAEEIEVEMRHLVSAVSDAMQNYSAERAQQAQSWLRKMQFFAKLQAEIEERL